MLEGIEHHREAREEISELIESNNNWQDECLKEKEKNKQWEDKIREKIEELERKLKNETLYISFWAIHSKIRVLKKLLEE